MFSFVVLASVLSLVTAGLRGDAATAKKTASPSAAPTTFAEGICPQYGFAVGRSCSDDLRCFEDRSNYVFSEPTASNPYNSITVNNCITKGAGSTISFISISNCASSCTKTDSVSLNQQVYSFNFQPDQYCTDLCIYVHDGQYKLMKPNNVTLSPAETGCVANVNQRCNLCNMRMHICRQTPSPTAVPTIQPSYVPTAQPSYTPTAEPTFTPSYVPTAVPTAAPTAVPSAVPTAEPTYVPTAEPTYVPTAVPTYMPTAEPTAVPTAQPSFVPTAEPTYVPTAVPTAEPTYVPTAEPTYVPTAEPTVMPTFAPTAEPTYEPTYVPTAEPTYSPTYTPTQVPTAKPSAQPTFEPTQNPTVTPTAKPTEVPTATPSFRPTANPTMRPTVQPTESPTVVSSACNPTCATGYCCCTTLAGAVSCVSQSAYGAGLDCPTVCANNACAAFGLASGYRTCGCMQACSGGDCSNLGQDGKTACNKQMNCCCGKSSGAGLPLSTACTACTSSNWLSAANCAASVAVV